MGIKYFIAEQNRKVYSKEENIQHFIKLIKTADNPFELLIH